MLELKEICSPWASVFLLWNLQLPQSTVWKLPPWVILQRPSSSKYPSFPKCIESSVRVIISKRACCLVKKKPTLNPEDYDKPVQSVTNKEKVIFKAFSIPATQFLLNNDIIFMLDTHSARPQLWTSSGTESQRWKFCPWRTLASLHLGIKYTGFWLW